MHDDINCQTKDFKREYTLCGIMIIILENRHGDQSSNPGWSCLHFI